MSKLSTRLRCSVPAQMAEQETTRPHFSGAELRLLPPEPWLQRASADFGGASGLFELVAC